MEYAQRLTLAEMREFVASSGSLTFAEKRFSGWNKREPQAA